MSRRLRVDLAVGLALLAAGGAGLAWQVQLAQPATAAVSRVDTAALPPLLCPLGPHLLAP